MFENNRLAVDAPGVLGNDHDLNANPLTATLVSTTSNGILELNPDGSFNYTPNDNFSGVDSFVYQAGNGSANSDLASVVITVTQVNDVPVATNDSFVVFANDSWAIDAPGILANDNDLDGNALTAALINTTTHGTLALNSDGSFIYTPNAGFVGTDTFTYVANDGQSDSNLAMVTITVAEPNVVPVAQNDGYETNEGSLLTVLAPGVLSNDFDANDNPLTAILVTAPLFGTVTLNSDGSFDYIPTANFSGTDSFSYKVTDGSADSNVAMVTINVNAGSGI
jgi:VCBS repeat-containing protein